jgi:putative membrane protein
VTDPHHGPFPGPHGRPPPAPPAPSVGPDPDEEWQRLHPLSPLLRGGVVLIAVLGYVVTRLVDNVLGAVDIGGLGGEGSPAPGAGPFEAAVAHPLWALALLVVVLGAVGLVSWVGWRFSRFRIASGQVELRTGMLFRQHRQVPLERIQAVELSRPLLARLLGLAQVVVQAAGGSDSNLTLAFIGEQRAEALRLHLLALAGRSDEQAPGGPVPDAPPPVGGPVPVAGPAADAGVGLVVVPNGRLFLATLLHGSTIVLGLIALVLASAGPLGFVAVLLGGIPALLPLTFGVVVGRVRELLVHGNFSLARTPTALRVRHGLTDLRLATVPLHRVQAVEVLQPLWWRPWGWWRVRVNVAGVHADGDRSLETTLLPVGTVDEVLAVLAALGARRDDPRLTEAMLGAGGEPGWVGLPAAARWVDPLVWRRAGYLLAPHAVVLRRGRWTRRAVVVPHARVQSLTLEQGPVQARLGLASARVVSTPGPVAAVLDHLAADDAEVFLDRVAARARAARRVAPAPPGRPGPTSQAAPLATGAPPLVD